MMERTTITLCIFKIQHRGRKAHANVDAISKKLVPIAKTTGLLQKVVYVRMKKINTRKKKKKKESFSFFMNHL